MVCCLVGGCNRVDVPIGSDAKELALTGIAKIEQRLFDDGLSCLRGAIEINPNDAGRGLQGSSKSEIDTDHLRFGEIQLRRLLEDRPALASCVSPGDELWNWTVRKLAGEDAGRPIEWDAKDPSPFDGDTDLDGGLDSDGQIWIQIGDVQDGSLEERCDNLWARLVLELYRAADFSRTSELRLRVRYGRISLDEYVLARMALEERAIEKTRAFYVTSFAPSRLSQGAQQLWPDAWYCSRFFSSRPISRNELEA